MKNKDTKPVVALHCLFSDYGRLAFTELSFSCLHSQQCERQT